MKNDNGSCYSDGASYKLIPQEDDNRRSGGAVPPDSYAGTLAPLEPAEERPEKAPTMLEIRYWLPKDMNPKELLDSALAQTVTVLLIALNALMIGVETDLPDAAPWELIEFGFLLLFAFELIARIYVVGLGKFFQFENNIDFSWNVFDFFIVTFGVLNLLIAYVFPQEDDTEGEDLTLLRMGRLLRILRVLRIIRIVRFLKQLYLLANGFPEGCMAVFWVSVLASFMLYICSIILVRSYGQGIHGGEEFDDFFKKHFGTIPITMFSLFELICAPNLRPYRDMMFKNPVLSCFLVTFIVVGSFGVNGLLVALINESILEKNMARLEAERIERETKRKILQQRCRELFDAEDVNKNRVLRREDLMNCKGDIALLFETLGVNFRSHDLDQMFYIMDVDDTGIIERTEFVDGVVELCDQIRPMSIMELHYQVSKCASKVSESDNKVEGLVKSVEDLASIPSVDVNQARGLLMDLRMLLFGKEGPGGSTGVLSQVLAKKSAVNSEVQTLSTSEVELSSVFSAPVAAAHPTGDAAAGDGAPSGAARREASVIDRGAAPTPNLGAAGWEAGVVGRGATPPPVLEAAVLPISELPVAAVVSDANVMELYVAVDSPNDLREVHGKLAEKMQQIGLAREQVSGDPVLTFVSAGGTSMKVSGPEDMENVQLPGQMKFAIKIKHVSNFVPPTAASPAPQAPSWRAALEAYRNALRADQERIDAFELEHPGETGMSLTLTRHLELADSLTALQSKNVELVGSLLREASSRPASCPLKVQALRPPPSPRHEIRVSPPASVNGSLGGTSLATTAGATTATMGRFSDASTVARHGSREKAAAVSLPAAAIPALADSARSSTPPGSSPIASVTSGGHRPQMSPARSQMSPPRASSTGRTQNGTPPSASMPSTFGS